MIIPGTFISHSLTLAQDIAHDHDIESEDWHIAIEALCEVIRQNIFCHIYVFFHYQKLSFCAYET
jgi:hypothetical protein